MAEAYLIRNANLTFSPAYPSDEEALTRVKVGSPMLVKFSQPRNWRNLKRFFKMFRFASHHLNEGMPIRYQNPEYLRKEILILVGHVTIHEMLNGETHIEAASVNYNTLDEQQFNEIYKLCADAILQKFLPGIDQQTFAENLKLFL